MRPDSGMKTHASSNLSPSSNNLAAVKEGLVEGRDIREFAVFENPPVGNLRPSIRDLLCLFLKTLNVSKCGMEHAHQVTPIPSKTGFPGSPGKYHDPVVYIMTFFLKAILGATEPRWKPVGLALLMPFRHNIPQLVTRRCGSEH